MKQEKKALILQGGWDGHEPQLVAKRFAGLLEKNGYSCTVSDTLDVLSDLSYLLSLDLVVACWTMGTIENDYVTNLSKAVGAGVGLTGCHGGLCDSFRDNTQWQFMIGGQWVSHPGGDGVEYEVNICHGSSPLVQGIEDFPVVSEQYYLHINSNKITNKKITPVAMINRMFFVMLFPKILLDEVFFAFIVSWNQFISKLIKEHTQIIYI